MNAKQSSPWNEITLEDYENHMSHNLQQGGNLIVSMQSNNGVQYH